MGYVRNPTPMSAQDVLTGSYEIDIAGTRVRATALAKPPYPYRNADARKPARGVAAAD
jgi:hypothetical protein